MTLLEPGSHTDQAGFTLVELLVVVVLGAVALAAAYQTLVANQRTYTVQAAQVQGSQALRSGADLLFAELREVSAPEGDLVAIASDSVALRAIRSLGFACDTATATVPNLTVKRIGRWFGVGDSAVALIDHDPERSTDDEWRAIQVTAVDTTATCGTGTESAQVLTLDGLEAADSILPGAPLRSFRHLTYGLFAYEGSPYLGRAGGNGSYELLAGPLRDAGTPLSFEYLDENGSATTDPLAVAEIGITMRTGSDVRVAPGEFVRDSITIRINTRN